MWRIKDGAVLLAIAFAMIVLFLIEEIYQNFKKLTKWTLKKKKSCIKN